MPKASRSGKRGYDRIGKNGPKFSTHMVEDYKIQLTKTGGNTIGQEGYSTDMYTVEDLTDGYSLTEEATNTRRERIMKQR